MTIYLPNSITSFSMYNEILPQLTIYYAEGNKENPTISFVNTEKMRMESIPVFMGILDIIYNINKIPVFLEFEYRPQLLYFLDHSLFFHYADNQLGYIDYNRELIGGFSEYISKAYRDVHILHVYDPIDGYFALSESDQLQMRSEVYEEMRYHNVVYDYGTVLNDVDSLWENDKENFKTLLAEMITNSRLYSMSRCYSFFSSDRHSSIISICDVGRGFEFSLGKKRGSIFYPREKVHEFELIKKKCLNKYVSYELNDYFVIMEALFYSQLQKRINMYSLKKVIADSNGILRIQTGNVQVVFSQYCRNCSKGIESCIECLLERISRDLKYSPVKCLESKFKGVRIEIEFRK